MNIAKYGTCIPQHALWHYLTSLVDRFYKILPMKEENEPSLYEYMDSFIRELTGFNSLFSALRGDSRFVSLIAILQYMIDNPNCPVEVVRREVFHAISICKCLRVTYASDACPANTSRHSTQHQPIEYPEKQEVSRCV